MLATLASALTAVLVHSSPFDVITAKDKEWSEYYNTGNWAGLQSCYNPAAEVVPPTADGFLLGNETGAFFRGAGLKNVSLTPLHVIQEAPALIHELGQATHSAGTFRYYVRWIKPMGADWQIALDVFPIGEAKSARSLVMVEDSAERETTTETTSLASWFSTSASAGRSRSPQARHPSTSSLPRTRSGATTMCAELKRQSHLAPRVGLPHPTPLHACLLAA